MQLSCDISAEHNWSRGADKKVPICHYINLYFKIVVRKLGLFLMSPSIFLCARVTIVCAPTFASTSELNQSRYRKIYPVDCDIAEQSV